VIYAIHADGSRWPCTLLIDCLATLAGPVSRAVPIVVDTSYEFTAVRQLGYRCEVKEEAKTHE
jgi:hypothetical protein